MNPAQYSELNEHERIVCHLHIFCFKHHLQDQDFWEIKQQALKVNWNQPPKSRIKQLKEIIKGK